jgi:RHS repeat-associated protein
MDDATGTFTTTYDALDRNQTVTNPADKTITYAYDAIGQRAQMTNPDAGVTTYSFNANAQIDHLVNPESDRTSYSYDNAGRRTVKKLANGTRASFTHDAADRLTVLANMDSSAAYISRFDYEYDDVGNRKNVLEVSGDRVTWSYDNTYQLTAEHRSGSNAYAQTFTYDAAGNRTLKNIDSARTTTVYDAANQLDYSVAAAGRTTYTFDNNGNQQIVEAPNGDRTTNTWDYENLTTKVEQPGNSVSTYTWNADNHRVGKNVDGTETKMVWDDENILLETDGSNSTKVIYTLEPQVYGNVISERRKDGVIWTPSYYHFDALGSTRNLTDENENVTDTWIYDAYGNIISHIGASETTFLWIGELQYYYDPDTGQYTARLRIYDPVIARWVSPDPLDFIDSLNRYVYVLNQPTLAVDPTGNFAETIPWIPGPFPFLPIPAVPCAVYYLTNQLNVTISGVPQPGLIDGPRCGLAYFTIGLPIVIKRTDIRTGGWNLCELVCRKCLLDFGTATNLEYVIPINVVVTVTQSILNLVGWPILGRPALGCQLRIRGTHKFRLSYLRGSCT